MAKLLGSQRMTGILQTLASHLECGIAAQLIKVITVLVSAVDRKNARTDHAGITMKSA